MGESLGYYNVLAARRPGPGEFQRAVYAPRVPDAQYDVFLSHSSKDKPLVRELAKLQVCDRALRSLGHRPPGRTARGGRALQEFVRRALLTDKH